MSTNNTVVVTDGELGQLSKKQFELYRRVKEGTLPADEVLKALQLVIEGKEPVTPTIVTTASQTGHGFEVIDGIIYFSVTSDGTTGVQWIKRLEKKGFRVGDYAKSVLRSDDFGVTTGVTTKIGVIPGTFFKDSERITKKIRAEADKRKWTKPNAEVACLFREMFSDEELEAIGLWYIVAMHEPIKDSDGGPSLLFAGRRAGGRWLKACCDGPDDGWRAHGGFAFAVSQVSPQN